MSKNIKIHYETLPRSNNGKQINWEKSIGKKIKFECIDIKGEMEIISKEKDYICVLYNNDLYKIPYSNFINSSIKKQFCPYIYKYNIGDNIKDDKRDLTITNRYVEKNIKNNRYQKRYEYHCNKCGYNGSILETNLRLDGCMCCSNKIVIPGINDICTTDPWMVPYFQGGEEEAELYTYGSNKRIYPKCPDCGKIKDKSIIINSIYKNHSIGCNCNDNISYPEKFFMSVLKQLKVDYIYQFSKTNKSWVNNFRYDFYIYDKDCIVEINGDQHNDSHGNWADINKIKEYDKQKELLAIQNSIKYYIKIDCKYSTMEYIKESLFHSDFHKLYDLNKVNWIQCDKDATKNIVKEVCSAWKKDYSITTGDLSKIFKLNLNTISKYLKIGNKFGWCNYNPKIAKKFAGKKVKNVKKNVDVFKDGVLIISYPSLTDAELNSLNNLGTKLCAALISKHYKNNKPYKGYTFKIYKNGILL